MTQFVHCRGCGAQIHETAPTCPKCGAPQMVAPAASAQPHTTFNQASTTMSAVNLSAKWQEVFALIEKAGGADLPNLHSLSPTERKKVTRNHWAGVFSWIYFFVKGMWKKGCTYLALMMVVGLILEALLQGIFGPSIRGMQMAYQASNLVVFITAYIFASRSANTDFYKKTKTNWNGWW